MSKCDFNKVAKQCLLEQCLSLSLGHVIKMKTIRIWEYENI